MSSALRRLKNKAHLILALTATVYHRFPSKGLTIIGVTGTDGKTTTSNLIYHILRKNGFKTALISTIGAVINDIVYETGFHVTTPSPFAVQKYIKLAREKGCTHMVIEVTSHAMDQNRVSGIKFDIGVLTNITHEHLDYHKSYEKYVTAKLKLLKKARVSVVNSSGEWFGYVKKIIDNNKFITFSLHGKDDDVTLINLPFKINTSLAGDFNLENILASVGVARVLDIEYRVIASAITDFNAPIGRQQVMSINPLIMVDFAHTPNSFENLLPALRQKCTGRIIHVFGSAGQRDKAKRPKMGKVASYYDDIIVLTSEDPRSEKIADINRDIKKGINNGKELYEIEDREKAISFAISKALRDDVVLVTGKGHERSMNLGNGEVEWSDQEVIKKILKQ